MTESEEEFKSLLITVKEENEKAGLKLNIQKTKIIASDAIILWQLEGEKVEAVTDFILGGSKIIADGDCSHEIKRLAPWKKSYEKSRQCIKSRDITLPINVYMVKAMSFPVLMYRCESWILKRAEH